LLAATAIVHGLTVVTRQPGDFESMGVAVISPWHASNETSQINDQGQTP